jgi:ectoine hydroxylase-related dioxygenase (phytanoyl-CoA dioxygenase family)
MFDKENFIKEINEQGYSIVPNVLSPEFITETKKQLELAIEKEVAYHQTSSFGDYGMVLLCSLYGSNFIDLFNNPVLLSAFNSILGDGSIVYAYTSSSMPPLKTNYSNRIHVDCPRLIPGYITNLGATILLDDFTEENGATYFMPYSQNLPEPPSEQEFKQKSKRLIAKAGTVWFFNARVWHAGGNNSTNNWRHALTVNMCRPYMKQRIDIPRAMANMDLSSVSSEALQKLGFYAQVPASYDEYYAAPEKRKFKQKAE